MSKSPNARKKEVMRVTKNRKIGEISQGLLSALRCQFTSQHVPPKDLRDLQIQEVRRVQGLSTGKQALLNLRRRGRSQEHLKDGRSIRDDHRLSRSFRTI